MYFRAMNFTTKCLRSKSGFIQMKLKFFCLSLLAVIFASCNDNNEIGMSVLPEEDAMAIVSDSFYVNVATVEVGDVYSETTKPVLGTFEDEMYGSFSVDFVSDFRYVRDFAFPDGAVCDSMYLVMYYRSFFGDSSAVQEATAYGLDLQTLDFSRDFSINTDISEFCSMNEVLGRATYVAYDRTVSDSIRELSDYCDKVRIKMPDKLAADIIADPSLMESQSNFNEFFKGVYVRNTYGSQTILDIDSVNLEMYYKFPPDLEKPDSLVYGTLILPANLESTTFVHVSERTNPQLSSLKEDLVSISSPGGVMLRFDLPWDRIYGRICGGGGTKGININHASLIMNVKNVQYDGELEPPTYVMLIREEDVPAFFTQSLYPAPGINTYLGVFNESDSTYLFANMADFLQKNLDGGPSVFEQVGNVVVLPVGGTTDVAGTDASIYNSMLPSGAVFGSGTNAETPFRMVVTYTEL